MDDYFNETNSDRSSDHSISQFELCQKFVEPEIGIDNAAVISHDTNVTVSDITSNSLEPIRRCDQEIILKGRRIEDIQQLRSVKEAAQ